MDLDSEIRDQVYPLFVRESLDMLQVLEHELRDLPHHRDPETLHTLVRAAHSIKGGAGFVGLSAIQTLAHRLERSLRALSSRAEVLDGELAVLLQQAYDGLALPLRQQIQANWHDEADAIAQAEAAFIQLEAKLGHSLEADVSLPSSAELGVDVTAELFATDIAQGLDVLEALARDATTESILVELPVLAETWSGFGEFLNVPALVAIARTVQEALVVNPLHAGSIAKLALADLRLVCTAVLEGSSAVAGDIPCPSPPLTKFTVPLAEAQPTSAELESAVSEWEAIDAEIASEPDVSSPSLDDIFGGVAAPAETTAFPNSDPAPAVVGVSPDNSLSTTRQQRSATAVSKLPSRLDTAHHFIWLEAGTVFVVPSDCIQAIVMPHADALLQLDGRQFLLQDEHLIPVVRLADMVNTSRPSSGVPLDSAALTASSRLTGPSPIALLNVGSQSLALAFEAESLFASQPLTLQSLGVAIDPPAYLRGCTLLPNHRLVPVVDVLMLLTDKLDRPTPANGSALTPPTPSASNRAAPSDAPAVLTIDDSTTLRKSLAFLLDKAGYRVLEAADGREALQLLYGNGAVQLIVCDIEMPRMNGFEFLQCRRADERLAQIPVVMLTAQDSDRHRQLATLLGANAYLAKPWNDAALLAEIATLLHPPVSATA